MSKDQMKPNITSTKRSNRGQALVPVILVVIILTTLAISFTATANREVKAASNFDLDTVRSNAARGAVNYAMEALDSISNHGYTYGMIPPGQGTDANGWMPVGDAWVKIDAIDTGACLNLNSATAATLEIFPVFTQNAAIADAIIDWRTPETTATSDGAKSTYYQGLNPPYNCKDAAYDTIEELLLVSGVTPTILYGTAGGSGVGPSDTQKTYHDGTNILSSDNGSTRQAAGAGTGAAAARPTGTGAAAGGGTAATATNSNQWDTLYSNSTIPLSEILTTTSMERNIAADGTARVNINTATAAQLTAIGVSSSLATAIVNYRTQRTGAAATGAGAGAGAGAGVTARPPTGKTLARAATVTGSLDPLTRQSAGMGGGRPGGLASGNPKGNATGATGGGTTSNTFKNIGDLMSVTGITASVMQQIADYVSTSSGQYNPNLVDINTAPAEVLATVSGMDQTTLDAITSYRQGGQVFQTMGDFFALSGLTRQEIQNVAGALCTKSSIYRVRIKVRTAGQDNIYAVQALVQLTDNGPQLIQYREVSRVPGWSYWVPSPVLQAPTTSPATGTSSGQ